MLITLITDASYFEGTQTGGWAAWAKSARGQVQRADALKGQVSSVSIAEARAFANGVAMLLSSDICQRGDRVLVQIDSLAVVHRLTGKGRKRMPGVVKAIDHALAQLAAAGVTIEARHIKAHVGTDKPRHYIHDQVDRAARAAALRVHRERIPV